MSLLYRLSSYASRNRSDGVLVSRLYLLHKTMVKTIQIFLMMRKLGRQARLAKLGVVFSGDVNLVVSLLSSAPPAISPDDLGMSVIAFTGNAVGRRTSYNEVMRLRSPEVWSPSRIINQDQHSKTKAMPGREYTAGFGLRIWRNRGPL